MNRTVTFLIRLVFFAVFAVPAALLYVKWRTVPDLFANSSTDASAWLGYFLTSIFGGFLFVMVCVLTARAHRRWEFKDAPVVPVTIIASRANGTEGVGSEQCDIQVRGIAPDGREFTAVAKAFINLVDMHRVAPGASAEVAYLPGDRVEFRRTLDGAGTVLPSTPAGRSIDR